MTDGASHATKSIGETRARVSNARMRTGLFIVLVFAACSSSSAKAPAPDPICGDGRKSATLTEWVPAERSVISFELACPEGAPTMRTQTGVTPLTYTLSEESWRGLWKELDAARWRDVATACSPADSEVSTKFPLRELGVSKVELVITDGKTTSKLACDVTKLGSQHVAMVDAITDAISGAGELSSID
jgi:hypothetical protein